MPIQNGREIEQLDALSQQLQDATRNARNHADIEEIQRLQQKLRDVQDQIQDARGKAINGSGTSTEPLFNAQVRVEECQHELKRALVNIKAQQEDTFF